MELLFISFRLRTAEEDPGSNVSAYVYQLRDEALVFLEHEMENTVLIFFHFLSKM